MKIFVLLALATAVAAAVTNKAVKRPIYDFIDYYDCSSKADGAYNHPVDCTRFIYCSNGNASDIPCDDCNIAHPDCAGSPYLLFEDRIKLCVLPVHGKCDPGMGSRV